MENRENYFKRRRQRKGLKLFWLVVILLSFMFLVYFLAFNRYLLIKNVEADAASPAKENIIALINNKLENKRFVFMPGNNFLFYNKDKITSELLTAEPSFESFTINFVPSTQVLKVEGRLRKPVGAACGKGPCFVIDGNGIPFSQIETSKDFLLFSIRDQNLGEIKLGKKLLPKELINFALEFKRINDSKIKINAVVIEENYLTARFLKLITEEGWYIFALFDFLPENVSENLKLILENEIKDGQSHLEYIDLRYEDKAYYKLK